MMAYWRRSVIWSHLGVNGEAQRRIEAAQPKRSRQKPVVCPVTGELTYELDGLSERAWSLMEAGCNYKQAISTGELKKYITCSDNWWAVTRAPTELRALNIMSPADRLSELYGRGSRIEYSRIDELQAKGYILLEEGENAIDQKPSSIYVFELTDEQGAAAKAIVNGMMDAARALVMPAYRAGQSLLLGIAAGSITMDDVSRVTAKISAKDDR